MDGAGKDDVLSEPEPSVALCDGMEPRVSADDVSLRSFPALSPPVFVLRSLCRLSTCACFVSPLANECEPYGTTSASAMFDVMFLLLHVRTPHSSPPSQSCLVGVELG